MTSQISKDNAVRLDRIAAAWKTFAPGREYFGLTVAMFKDAIQPSLDARTDIGLLKAQLRHAVARRDVSDRKALQIAYGVVSGVLSDRDHGDDSEFYAAMGYIPRSARRRPRRVRKQADAKSKDEIALLD